MKNIFIGFIFCFINININLDGCIIGLVPSFIGYIFIVNGLNELAGESERFIRMRPFSIFLAVYFGITYVLDILGLSTYLSFILSLVSAAFSIVVTYNIIAGIRDIESSHGVSLESDSLMKTWTVAMVFYAASYVSIIVPIITVFCIIASFVATIVFLVRFNRTRKLYEANGGGSSFDNEK